jgi:hypothetical protein
MIDLSAKMHRVQQHVEECLTDFAARNGRAGLLFYHSHPNYGQVHIYTSHNVDAQPYEDLVGKPINYVLDFEGWSEMDTWWLGEDSDRPVLKLPSGEVVQARDNADFNVRWAEHLDILLKHIIPTFSEQIRPARVIVQSENGEYVSDWRTKT